jgi:molecular chaperone GrpE
MTVKPDRANPEQEESTGGDPAPQGAAAGDRGSTAGAGEPGPDEALAAERARADENWDKYLRAAAELENVRKRAARDAENARRFALERFATELLAVRDSLEMGLAAADAADVGTLIEGNRAILKQLTATMERFGVVEVDPEGEPFDPSVHEAMTTQPSTEVEPNTVVTVFQKGYLLSGRLLRPARVVVAAAPE